MLTTSFSPADCLLALYPEIHYRFRYFKFNRYFRREPEILVDIPRRIEGSQKAPLLLLVKDAHQYPIKFTRPLKVTIEGDASWEEELYLSSDTVETPWWWRSFDLKMPPGDYRIWVEITYRTGRSTKRALNHNFRGLTPTPFLVKRSAEPLPRPPGYLLGDVHCHSIYTADQVEFGAPLHSLAKAARASGLDFACVADHSYDLDDMPEDYLTNDPQLRKWKDFLKRVEKINSDDDDTLAKLIAGQEATVVNGEGRNVHMLLFGGDKLFSGGGDSAEKWFKTDSELSVSGILSSLDSKTVAGAAHPWEPIRFLQKTLLRRGMWNYGDFAEGISGAQIANGEDFPTSLRRGIPRWIELLKQGKRIGLWAGNDSHGNFNIFRQVKLPMWSLWEREAHILGMQKTGVYAPKGAEDILQGLRRGGTYITDGPGIELRVEDCRMGETAPAGSGRVEIDACASQEFGRLKNISLFIGSGGRLIEKRFDLPASLTVKIEREFDLLPGFVYAAAETTAGQRCVSSAVYIE